MLATLPACTASLMGPVDSVVTCSDALEVGRGLSRSVRLSELGQTFVQDLRRSVWGRGASGPDPAG